MAALTETQLQSACRAKLPVTVVRDEDYTTLTPTQIADAWTAYSGGTVGVRLKDTDDIWYAMDPDLPKANGRGLLVFGGGKQYAQRCDFADCTVGQALPASWAVLKFGFTVVCSGKSTIDGIPAVQAEISGTATSTSVWFTQPPSTKVPDADIATGDIITARSYVYIESLPAEVTSLRQKLSSGAQVVNTYAVLTTIDEWQIISASSTEDSVAGAYNVNDTILDHANGATYSTTAVISMGPSLISVNTAFPDYFHCLNTSTSSAATIVPEILQRPWEYEGPWSVELEFVMPPRNLGSYRRLWALGDDADRTQLFWAPDNTVRLNVEKASVVLAQITGPSVAANGTAKVVIYSTAQTTRWFVSGTEYTAITHERMPFLLESLGHQPNGVGHSFSTFKSYKYRKGLATTAQLIEWSTAA